MVLLSSKYELSGVIRSQRIVSALFSKLLSAFRITCTNILISACVPAVALLKKPGDGWMFKNDCGDA